VVAECYRTTSADGARLTRENRPYASRAVERTQLDITGKGATMGATAATATAKVDYLEFTVPAEQFYDVLKVLPGLIPQDRGWRGYVKSALVASGKGFLGWHPERPEMGVHCSLGAQALGVLAGTDDRWADLPGMLAHLRDRLGGKVTRLDVAWDDQSGLLDVGRIEQEVRDGNFTSRWKGGHVRWGWGNQSGETLNFGYKGSDAMLRIYDKLAERHAKIRDGKADPSEVEGIDHWTRVELQLRRKRADVVAGLFQNVKKDAQAVFIHLAGVLRGYLEFKVPNPHDSNKRRWEPASWWLAFLGWVEKARLVIEQEVRTVDQVREWIATQVAPSLAVLDRALGRERTLAYLTAEMTEARSRLGPRHRAILAASGVPA